MQKRNFIGYGKNPPKVNWPNNARVAINFVINYEEGAEHNILDGDAHSESYLVDIPNIKPIANTRNLSCESMFEYGSRCGIWRLIDVFNEFDIQVTFFVCGLALRKNDALIDYLKNSEHEIAGHGYRWIDYQDMDEISERTDIEKTLNLINETTGKKVYGWYTGRKSKNTRKLLVQAGLEYDSDGYADDLPYWELVDKRQHLIIPYCLVNNDCHYTTNPGYSSPNDFFLQLKYNFDCLYREGLKRPKMMSIGLHSRLSGKPARCEALREFLIYISKFNDVWICKRYEIAAYWKANHLNT